MASIRKREWVSPKGDQKSAWVVDYTDQHGKRHLKTFDRKKDAEAWRTDTAHEVRRGTHTADSVSITVTEAGERWIDQAGADELEASTIAQYRQHLDLHIKPFLGDEKLSRLTGPRVRDFKLDLRKNGRSDSMVSKVVVSLGSIISDALEAGLVAQNVVRDGSTRKRRRNKSKGRHKTKVEIPTLKEINAFINNAEDRWRPLIITAIFTGLRASELRGLTWGAVDLSAKVISVRQRADRWNEIGPPKSGAGYRDVPLAPMVVNALREWKLACPKGDLSLVFPNGAGNVEALSNIDHRGFGPLQLKCGAWRETDKKDDDGNPVRRRKYGLHALRHAAASLFIDQGFQPKRVQVIMGHAGIQMTFDTYGHLFPKPADDQTAMEELQARLVAEA